MKKGNFSWAVAIALAWSPIALSGEGQYVGYHQDYRKAPKLVIDLNHKSQVGGDAVSIAKDYLSTGASKFQWSEGGLELMKVKKSLTGTHVHFQQMKGNVPVRKGEVVISVDTRTQTVYQVFNNYFPGKPKPLKMKGLLSKDRAFDIAWQDLKVHGKIQGEPSAKTMYVVAEDGSFKLAHITYLNVEAPFGAWEHVIDAETGEIITTKDTRLERKKSDMAAMKSMYKGPVADRATAFDAFKKSSAAKAKLNNKSSARRADGTGFVFDPDPRTTLMDSSLQDDSDAAMFEDAYFNRELLDLTLDGDNYTLVGPWITLADFESPNVAPATTTDGNWMAKRGDVAFNDVMTYYHIDKNQRYMQSLGFTGDRAVQGGSIEVDANGLSGADNSHFIPSSNRMAFGHGCVDDNEDADVILHEYGHAINYSINSSWGGGDSGAMGEGFGDYWAGSYSISAVNGMDYEKENVFTWDAHGDGNPCWPGRILNALALEYDHSRSYGAHSGMGGGRQTDELWSTPLFQSLLTLLEMGRTREEVDQIVLEAQFGMGGGLKMRDLANATVNAARRLFPDGPHAGVFFQKFAHHGIVEAPQAILETGELTLTGMGDNNVVDPGETITLEVGIDNRGTFGATGVNAMLSTSSDLVTIGSAISRYPELEIGSTAVNETPFTFTVENDFVCGDTVDLNVGLTFEGGATTSANLPLTLTTGVPQGVEISNDTAVEIPDDDEAGAMTSIMADGDGMVSGNLRIQLDIEHTYIGDLEVSLTSPAGTTVLLHNNSGGGSDNIQGTYGEDLSSAESLTAFVGEAIAGEWVLKVVDSAGADTGSINSWTISDITGYECE